MVDQLLRQIGLRMAVLVIAGVVAFPEGDGPHRRAGGRLSDGLQVRDQGSLLNQKLVGLFVLAVKALLLGEASRRFSRTS